MDSVVVKDIGPIGRVSIPIPEHGGVVVLRGRNGAGKTTCINAASALLGGKELLSKRDGTSVGSIEGFGARLSVNKSTRRSGELEVSSIAGDFDISDLIDPRIKDPAAADKKRIEALLSLTGIKADSRSFAALADSPEEFDAIAKPESLNTEDIVYMASHIKRDFEAAARNAESQATTSEGHANGLKEATAGIDLTAESDAAILQANLEAAIAKNAALQADATSAKDKIDAAKQAQANLDAMAKRERKSIVSLVTDEELAASWLAIAKQEHNDAQAALEDLEAKVRQAQAALDQSANRVSAKTSCLEAAKEAREAGEREEALLDGWKQTIAASTETKGPSQKDIELAATTVTSCREAIEIGAAVRKAKEQIASQKQHAANAKTLKAKAERLRQAAKATEDVLSDAIQSGLWRISEGRLVVQTARGLEFVHDLSPGIRGRMAIDIVADHVPADMPITVSQEVWEGLDPYNQNAIDTKAKAKGVVVLSAEADWGELRAEVYQQQAKEGVPQ